MHNISPEVVAAGLFTLSFEGQTRSFAFASAFEFTFEFVVAAF